MFILAFVSVSGSSFLDTVQHPGYANIENLPIKDLSNTKQILTGSTLTKLYANL